MIFNIKKESKSVKLKDKYYFKQFFFFKILKKKNVNSDLFNEYYSIIIFRNIWFETSKDDGEYYYYNYNYTSKLKSLLKNYTAFYTVKEFKKIKMDNTL